MERVSEMEASISNNCIHLCEEFIHSFTDFTNISHMPILCQTPRTGSHQALSSENVVGKTCMEAIQANYLTAVQGALRRSVSSSMGRRKSRKAFWRRWHLNWSLKDEEKWARWQIEENQSKQKGRTEQSHRGKKELCVCREWQATRGCWSETWTAGDEAVETQLWRSSVPQLLSMGRHWRGGKSRFYHHLPAESSRHGDEGIRQKCPHSLFNQHANCLCFGPGHAADKVFIIEKSWEAIDRWVEKGTCPMWNDKPSGRGLGPHT